MRSLGSTRATLLSLFAVLAAAGSARALAIEPSSAPFHEFLGHRGAIEFLAVEHGAPPGGTVLTGEVPVTAPVVTLRIRLADDSLALPDFFLLATPAGGGPTNRPIAGAGRLDGAERGVEAMAIVPNDARGELLAFRFDGSLQPGEVSAPLFVAWPGLSTGHLVGVLLETGPPRPPFGRREFFGGTVVPEPAPATLVAVGLVALLRARRARRTTSRRR